MEWVSGGAEEEVRSALVRRGRVASGSERGAYLVSVGGSPVRDLDLAVGNRREWVAKSLAKSVCDAGDELLLLLVLSPRLGRPVRDVHLRVRERLEVLPGVDRVPAQRTQVESAFIF